MCMAIDDCGVSSKLTYIHTYASAAACGDILFHDRESQVHTNLMFSGNFTTFVYIQLCTAACNGICMLCINLTRSKFNIESQVHTMLLFLQHCCFAQLRVTVSVSYVKRARK